MTELVLWVDDLERASGFYEALLGLKAKVDSVGYRQLVSAAHKLHLHEVPVEYRSAESHGSALYPMREDAVMKPVFAVASITDALQRTVGQARLGKAFGHDEKLLQDVIDPEGNVIQLLE
jgi:catechol 2,3-dioxygenase-like lactoylglutathione lyase family enzyme